MFLLIKWYFDVVGADGAAFIGYAARLRWGRLRLRYASLLLAPPDGPVSESATIRRVDPPIRSGRSFHWRNDALGVTGQWRASRPPIHDTLLSTRDGGIDWACFAPSALARVQAGSLRIEGIGYVERIRVSIAPGKLPFDQLRWGRFLSADHALVWIAWDGGYVLRRAWLDGRARHDACPSPAGIIWPGGSPDLRFSDRRILRERTVHDTLSGHVPALAKRLPGVISAMREVKWLSRATLRDERGESDSGWAIHEHVTWAEPSPS